MTGYAKALGVDVGKILDPFADVFARLTYFVCMSHARVLPLWFLLIVLYRELGIILIRLLLFRRAIALGAKALGKLKSWFYSMATAVALYVFTVQSLPRVPESLLSSLPPVRIGAYVIYVAAAILAIWSVANYAAFYVSRKRASRSQQDSSR